MSSTTPAGPGRPGVRPARLRERAAARGTSLSAYVRELLADDAAQETMNEVIERIGTRAPVEVSDEEILAVVHDGRR